MSDFLSGLKIITTESNIKGIKELYVSAIMLEIILLEILCSWSLAYNFLFFFLRQSQIGQTSVKPSRQPKLSFQSSCLQTPDAGMMGVHLYNAGDETQRFVHVSKASYQDKYTPKLCCLSEIFNWTSCILFSSLAVAVIV